MYVSPMNDTGDSWATGRPDSEYYMRILVVDDDPEIISFLKRGLTF